MRRGEAEQARREAEVREGAAWREAEGLRLETDEARNEVHAARLEAETAWQEVGGAEPRTLTVTRTRTRTP